MMNDPQILGVNFLMAMMEEMNYQNLSSHFISVLVEGLRTHITKGGSITSNKKVKTSQ